MITPVFLHNGIAISAGSADTLWRKNGALQSFKRDDFGSLRQEVHTMRGELNDKIDVLLDKVNAMAIQNAKWMGAGGVIIFIGQFLINKFF